MAIPRIYQPVPLHFARELKLDQTASHHIAHVLRARLGDSLLIFNGQQGEHLAQIIRIEKEHVYVSLGPFYKDRMESALHLHLAQGILSGDKMDGIVQKAVELGVKSIIPLVTQRCNIKREREKYLKRQARWQSIVIHACEQTGRTQIPPVHFPRPFFMWIEQLGCFSTHHAYFILLSTQASSCSPSLLSCCAPFAKNMPITLLVGPEGGWDPMEEKMAVSRGCQLLNLGPRILRAETASIAIISIMQYGYGDMRKAI